MISTTRLLLVERDPALHAIVVAALRNRGIAVTWARDSAEALQGLRTRRELEQARRLLTGLPLDDECRARLDDALGRHDARRRTLLAALSEGAF